MQTKSRNTSFYVRALLFLSLIMVLVIPIQTAQAVGSTIYIDNLQPNYTSPGGGGVWSAYYGPASYAAASPGTTAIYDGREAGIIKAGITVDPISGNYEDEGIFAFKVASVDVSTFATQTLTYDVQNETGANPVWVRIRLVGGIQYQFVPTTNPASWHTVDAAAGDWYLMDVNGNATGPARTLAQVATDNPGAMVDRVYLTMGMGNSYNVSPGVGTVGWVDKVTIDTVTYDFILPTYWYVTTTGADTNEGTLASPFLTIQHAIDLANPGDTIHVAAGTFTEQLTITKNLHLVGAGAGLSIIAAPATLPASSNAASSIVLISGAGVNVELTGFTVTGPGPSGCGSIRTGMYVYDGANANLHHNSILNISDNPLSGCQNGVAIAVGRQFWGTTGTATIANNTISGYQKGGIVVDNTGSSATITDNVITGIGTTSIIAQNGIQISRGATATLSGNTVSGNSFHLDGSAWDWGSAGILLYQAGPVTLAGGNTASNNDTNLYIDSATGVTIGAETFGPSSAPLDFGYNVVNLTTLPLNLTGVTFPGAANNFAIEDRIWHGVDDPALGLATWVAGNLYVTPLSGTIQGAIDLATAGDTVNVDAGTYVEDLSINKAITLLGPNASINPNTGSRVAEAVIHPAVSAPDPGVCEVMAYLTASNVTIKGFMFNGDNPSLTSGVMIGAADVDACELIASYEGVGSITVENNILKNSTYSGIDFYNYYNSGAATTNNYIRYNRFESIGTSTYGYGMGVLIYNNFYAAITDNVMTGVRVGIQTGNFSQANPGSTNSISNNQIGSWRLGLFHNLWYGPASPLTVSNNTFTAENYAGATNYSGILLSSMGTTVSATVTGNIVTVPGTDTHSGYTAGYNVWNVQNTAPITISGGTVTGGDYGVFVNNWEGYSSDADNTFIIVNGVTILGSDIAGVYVKDSDSNTNGSTVYADVQNSVIDTNATGILVYGPQATAKANYNNLAGNPTAGITNGNTTFTMDGTYNWWGSATGPGPVGPGTGVNVSTFVDFDPWCVNGTCTAPVHNVTQLTDFYTIQAAIDAANNGDVINIDAGTYVENVNVTKSVTLAGAGAGSTIIIPALSNPNCNTGGGGSLCGGAASNVFSVAADNVVIHGLTVDGDNPALTSGIVRSGADLDARNGIITNHALGTFNGLEIYDVTVQNIYLRGIYASSSGSFNIHNNTITNVQGESQSIAMMNWMGTGTFASNSVSNSNDGIVSNHSRGVQYLNNTVTSSGSGIHSDNNGSSGGIADLIQGNTVYDCAVNGYGIWVFAPYLNVSVNSNTVTNCAVGLAAAGSSGGVPTFTNNTVDGQNLAGSTGLYVTTSLFGWGSANINASFTGNIIRNNDVGVELESEPTYTLTGTFATNQIYGNGAGVHTTSTGAFVGNFEHNWWGHITGPSGVGTGSGDSIVAGFDYTQWCGNAACTFFEPILLGAPVGTITSWDKTFHLTGISGATFHRVELQTATGTPIYADWFPASSTCSGLTCVINAGWSLPNGDYRWRSRDYSPVYEYGVYTPWQYFTLNVSIVVPTYPVGTLTSWDKTFQWNGLTGSTHYRIEVQTAAGAPLYGDWFTAASACSGLSCSLNPGWNLPNGDYRWRSRDYSSVGYGLYTDWLYFTLNTPVVTLGVPSGTLTSWNKSFNLTGIDGSTYYRVEVQTEAGTPLYADWFPASSTCSGLTCSINPGWDLPNGDYRWRSRDYNPTTGYGLYTDWQTFTLNIAVTTLGSPSGTLTSWNKSFNWTGIPDATYYRVEVQTAAGTPLHGDWFTAASACSGVTCSLNPGWDLPNGDYRWRSRDYNATTGYGLYTDWQYFTLNLSTVTLGAPAGTLTSWDQVFNWTGISGVTYYRIEVQTEAGSPLYGEWFPTSATCSGLICAYNPSWSLANGDYRWRIRVYDPSYGYGAYTDWQNFTLNLP